MRFPFFRICIPGILAAVAGAQDVEPAMIDMRPGDTHLARTPAAALVRWMTLDTASIGTRYRWAHTVAGAPLWNQQQHQLALRGALHAGSFRALELRFGLFTGSGFLAGWNNTGPGTGRRRANLYLKQLALEVRPLSGLTLEAGGLDFLRGLATEITSFDADGYLVGQRVRVRRKERFFFEEISFANGYLGNLNRPGVLPRLGSFARSNYRQVLVTKSLREGIHASAEYAWEAGSHTFRQSVSVRVPDSRWIDSVRFEQVAIANSGYGFATYGEKRMRPWLTGGSGVSRHPRAGLYSDRFGPGWHWFGNLLVAPARSWSTMVQVTQALGGTPRQAQGARVDVVFGYNLRAHRR